MCARATSFLKASTRSKNRDSKTRPIVNSVFSVIRNRKDLVSLCAVLLLSACATTQKQEFTHTGDSLTDGKSAVAQGPAKDKVLWEYRTGLTVLRRGNIAEAQNEFGDALLTIGNIYGNDKSAKKSRSYFSSESKKTFLGEPYERVMAY